MQIPHLNTEQKNQDKHFGSQIFNNSRLVQVHGESFCLGVKLHFGRRKQLSW